MTTRAPKDVEGERVIAPSYTTDTRLTSASFASDTPESSTGLLGVSFAFGVTVFAVA